MIYIARPDSSSDILSFTHSALLSADGTQQPINVTGTSRPLAPGTYAWTKTGPNSGVLALRDATASKRLEVVFTSDAKGTYREFSTRPEPIPGTIAFAPVPVDTRPPLLNLSTRATLVADQPVTVGFVVQGTILRRVLVRAIGPSLAQFGVSNVTPTTSLAVVSRDRVIATNDGWGGAPELSAVFTSVGAFGLPAGSRDSAVVLTLAPGDYTVQVRGGAGAEVLVEVYLVD